VDFFLPTKGVEYLLVIGYLLLLIPLSKLLFAERARTAAARVAARGPADNMFQVPKHLMFHEGHTWARLDGRNRVAVGLDDFARQLVGPLEQVELPEVGARVEQGTPAMALAADDKKVNVLSPVTGRVTAVNPAALRKARAVNDDPYGTGWLMEVEVPNVGPDSRHLVTGRAARQLMSNSWEELSGMFTPELGMILHDGGTPVDGFARVIDGQHWDEVARRFLRS
jgi:glycine cleavage system H lipoate-binding protein